jgi:hypothetical protein
VDPKWWYRAGFALVVIVFIVLIARLTIVGMRPDTAKIDRAVGGEGNAAPARTANP